MDLVPLAGGLLVLGAGSSLAATTRTGPSYVVCCGLRFLNSEENVGALMKMFACRGIPRHPMAERQQRGYGQGCMGARMRVRASCYVGLLE